jgi:hypothetical protein
MNAELEARTRRYGASDGFDEADDILVLLERSCVSRAYILIRIRPQLVQSIG